MNNFDRFDIDPKGRVCFNCTFNGGDDIDDSGNIICDKFGTSTNPKCANLECFVKDTVDKIVITKKS